MKTYITYSSFKTCLIFLTVFLSAFLNYKSSSSQPTDIVFERLNVKNGLSHNNVYAILQDDKGYLWFGTQDGLNKYDGYKITIYRHDPSNENSLKTGNFGKIFQDTDGTYWFGTYGGGVDHFDPETNTFTNYSNDPEDPQSLSNNQITFLYKDKFGFFWVGTASGGINKFKPENRTFEHFMFDKKDSASLSNRRAKCITETSDGTLYIGTGNGLNKLNRKSGSFTRYFHDPLNKNSLSANIIQHLYTDKNDIIWIATRNGGLNRFDPKTETFTHYKNDPNNPNSISDNQVEYLYIDSDDNFWVGTYRGGLNLFDREKGIFKCFKHDPNKDNSLSSNRVEYIYEDRSKMLWIATRGGGLNKLDLKPAKFKNLIHDPNNPNSIPHTSVMSFYSDSEGNLWIGTDGGGLSRINIRKNTYKHFKHTDLKNSISGNRVWSILIEDSDIIWAGTYASGLNRIEYKNGRYIFNNYRSEDYPGLSINQINCITQDHKENIWIGTANGLVKLLKNGDPKTFQFKSYFQNKNGSRNVIDNYISYIYYDSKNRLWIGSYLGGLFQFLPDEEKFISYSPSKLPKSVFKGNIHVVSIYEDQNHNILVGTESNGLLVFDPEELRFSKHSKNEQFLSNMIMGMFSDELGNLWISTSRGLSKYSYKDDILHNYTNTDGIESEGFNRNAFHEAGNGTMYLGSNAGLSYFTPNDFQINKHIPNVVITDLKILNKSYRKKNLLPFDSLIKSNKEIVLTHKDYFFSIEFAALDFTSPKENEYQYMLEGLDRNWIYATESRTATYTNLDPGLYTFKVKGSNNDKVWNETPTEIKIRILPPFWKKPWFYLLEGLAGLLILILYVRSRTGKLVRDKKILALKVDDRTKEINQQKEELKTQAEKLEKTNQELEIHKNHLENLVRQRTAELEIAKNKAEESDKLKSAFLANMSHEIRTPMNAIIGFSSLLNEPENNPLKKKELISYIIKSSETLLQLIDDIIDISKIEAGQLDIKKEVFDIYELFDDLNQIYKEKNTQNNDVNIIFKKKQKTGLDILSDKIRLKQVFINLIDNAIKFTEKGSIEIGCKSDTDNKIIFYVKDTGIGMSKDQIQKIFIRFTKLENERKKLFRGAGLGLSICKKIIELLGGRIWVESTINVGSTFYFELPFEKNLKVEKPDISGEISISAVDLSNKLILIAEDEISNFRLLELYLSESKIQIIHAKNGPETFKMYKEHNPDLILLDIKLPVEDGFQIIKKIREQDIELPVIAQTAFAMQNDKEQCINAGFNDYISKPIDQNSLINLLYKYLSK